jgi:Xaa-Pro aminopeptidase
VVTADDALLWTDGRYFLQAEAQLGPGWTLMRAGTPGVAEPGDWLAGAVGAGGRVGVDPWCHTAAAAAALAATLADAGASLVPLVADGNLVDAVWGAARPPPPTAPVRVHPLTWAGEPVPDKLARLRAAAVAAGAGGVVATALDEVAWLFNLRGGDVEFNPVFRAYAVVTADAATLYVDAARLTPEAAAALAEAGVATAPYGRVAADVAAAAASGVRLWADPTKVSHALAVAAREAWAPGGKKRRRAAAKGAGAPPPAKPLVEKPSPITAFKAIKNEAELAGMDEAHARDGVALATALAWIDARAAAGEPVNEVTVDDIFTGARAAQPGFIEPSFPTIAGADGNGAVIHYRADPATAAAATATSMLLIDSGGQYECGTTDVTRTVHLGKPGEQVRDAFTRVLRGHIALATCVFPEGTPGLALDALARLPLWAAGLNYRHGTGHGVGAALCVHEGPHSISTRLHVHAPLEEGMIVSIEPGYYEEGAFGVRIENLVSIERADTAHAFGGSKFFKFRPLTLAPLQAKLIDVGALSAAEVAWVDAYHATVWETIAPRVADAAVKEWLRGATAPLPRA